MFIKIETLTTYEKEIVINDDNLLKTNININKIEEIINNILDKHNEICKYYINITENLWTVSFNVGIDQLEEMCNSSFNIYLFKDINNNSIINLSKEINEYHQWSEVKKDILKKLKK